MNEFETYRDGAEIRHTIGAQGSLSLQAISGSVDVRATDGDEAIVVARSESGHAESLPLVVQRTDGGLHIEVAKRGLDGITGWFQRNDASIRFEAQVPRGARVTIHTVSSDVSAHLLAGEQTYKTVSGDLELDADGGRVRATTVSGDIRLRAAQPLELTVSSTSGDIRVSGAVVTSFNAQTVSGDVEFEAGLAPGPLHSVETVSGDLSVESTSGVTVEVKRSMRLGRGDTSALVAGDGSAQLRFRTLSGDCHVEGARTEGRGGKRHKASQFMTPAPPTQPTPPEPEIDQLEVLRALERGEIDVDEAARRLQEV